jgi:hypothetical protein
MKANYQKVFIRNKLNHKEEESWIQGSEAFPRYAYRDSINVNIAAFDEGSMVMDPNSYIWSYIYIVFDVFLFTRQMFLAKNLFRDKIVVFKNLYYSSRSQFYRAFVVYREEIGKDCPTIVINTWLILKSRGKLIHSSPHSLIDFESIQTWTFIGNFILEDLVMVFKFYQMWDCKSWYLPLENINLNGFKSLLVKNKLEKKNSSSFEFDDDIEGNNNNNSIRNLNPEPDNVGEFSDLHKLAEKHSKRIDKEIKEWYHSSI